MTNNCNKPKLVLVLGSGFSAEAGLPTTRQLSSKFLEIPTGGVLPQELEEEISRVLGKF